MTAMRRAFRGSDRANFSYGDGNNPCGQQKPSQRGIFERVTRRPRRRSLIGVMVQRKVEAPVVDQGAFDASVYEQHAPRLMALAAALAGPSHADDVVASAVLAAITSRGWPTVENHGAYLTRAVVNQVADPRDRTGRCAARRGERRFTARGDATRRRRRPGPGGAGGTRGPAAAPTSRRVPHVLVRSDTAPTWPSSWRSARASVRKHLARVAPLFERSSDERPPRSTTRTTDDLAVQRPVGARRAWLVEAGPRPRRSAVATTSPARRPRRAWPRRGGDRRRRRCRRRGGVAVGGPDPDQQVASGDAFDDRRRLAAPARHPVVVDERHG